MYIKINSVPPTIRAIPQTGHVTARKGTTVTLECKASGNPVPSIYWFKKVILTIKQNSLQFHLKQKKTLLGFISKYITFIRKLNTGFR